jgi:glycosyltransferase domain-containing protein
VCYSVSLNGPTVAIDQRLTILIPTRNRGEFVHRLLHYFDQKCVPWPIVILDSSDPDFAARNKETVDSFESSLALQYVHDGDGLYQKVHRMLSQVETPYSVMCGDDDFLIPETLMQCLDFLDAHPDFVSCLGPSAIIDPSRAARWIEPAWPVNFADPVRRGVFHTQHWFPTFYALGRTQTLSRCFGVAVANSDFNKCRIFPELLQSWVFALDGSIQVLPELYGVRQWHGENEGLTVQRIGDPKTYAAEYQRFIGAIAGEMVEAGSIEEARARSLADRTYQSIRSTWECENQRVKRGGLARIGREIARPFSRLIRWIRTGASSRFLRTLDRDRLLSGEAITEVEQCVSAWPAGIPLGAHDASERAA